MYYASGLQRGCKHVMVSLQEVTMHVHACINSQNFFLKSLKTEIPSLILKISKYRHNEKLYSEYLNCRNGEVRCRCRTICYYNQVITASRYCATGSLRERLN